MPTSPDSDAGPESAATRLPTVSPTDPLAIRALAHPIRLDILEYLVLASPATAAQCGRALGQSQATCSFHLRQLAKYGFVEDAGPGADRRERLWRTKARRVSMAAWGPDDQAALHFNRVAVQREADRVLDSLETAPLEPPQWRPALGGIATTLALTSEEAAELRQKWREMLAPYEERTVAAGTAPGTGRRLVRYFLAATPLSDIDHSGENTDEQHA